jgi:hypothetical protein
LEQENILIHCLNDISGENTIQEVVNFSVQLCLPLISRAFYTKVLIDIVEVQVTRDKGFGKRAQFLYCTQDTLEAIKKIFFIAIYNFILFP